MRRLVLPLVLLLGIVPAAPTRADDDGDGAPRALREAQARRYFAVGARQFRDGEFAEAIASFQAGYARSSHPLFLFNIAQVARKSGQLELALDYYTRYLQQESSPAAPQRAEAEEQLARLRQRRASSPSAAPSPATMRATPAPELTAHAPSPVAPAPLVPAAAAPQPTAPATPQPTPALVRTAVSPRRATWSRGWFWGTLAGVVVVGVGVGVGTWLALRPRAPASPSLGSVAF